VTSAPTIVMTQRGARRAFQDTLAAAGVEVVQFDFLTPEAVAAYCQERGFLQARLPCAAHINDDCMQWYVRLPYQSYLISQASQARLRYAVVPVLACHALDQCNGLALVMMRLGMERRAGRACSL
jgi:hypothetical protein